MKEATRFKLAIGCLVMYFVEGIIKMMFPAFPLVELLAAEGVIVAYFIGAKTVSDVQYLKYNATVPNTAPPADPK